LLHLDGRDLQPEPLLKRKAALAEVVDASDRAGTAIRYSDQLGGPGG
jgi:ATP-dependent DNA ligase